jgi:dipeptidyl aminopeptidase/acylaminoacyl peptidase
MSLMMERRARGLLLASGFAIVLCASRHVDAALDGSAPPPEPRVYRSTVSAEWLPDGRRFWYQNVSAGNSKEFVFVDAIKGERRVVSQQPVPAATDRSPAPALPPPKASARSPDGKLEALVRDHNLWLRDVSTGNTYPLTTDASAGETFHKESQRARMLNLRFETPDEPASVPDVYWSPDSTRMLAIQTHTIPEHRVYLIEHAPTDQLQPKLQSYPYLKPGDEIPVPRPRLFSIADRREIALDDALFPTPWSLDTIHWLPDSSELTFLYNQRGHQLMRVVAVDARTGKSRAAIEERSRTFIDYAGKFFYMPLDGTHEALWMSERDGWNHLYLYDLRTGRVKNQITKGSWVVQAIDHIDSKRRQIWFLAGGIVPGQDPYYTQYCRINFDGGGLKVLTAGNGTHFVRWSPTGEYFIDTWSRVDLPPITELRRSADGKLILTLERADAHEVIDSRGGYPEHFVAKGRDGKTDIYGIIYWPEDLASRGARDGAKRYPIVERIYANPQASWVPTDFMSALIYPEIRALNDKGHVVVQIAGMGTSGRSKAFHDVAWQNLADAGFPDRIAWIKAAAEKYPALDISRVGIYGFSAGGQNALAALLWHGDFYRAAIADSGPHDNRLDKAWYGELWLGWPVGPQYLANSNVENAHRLQGRLLLVTGDLDRNVDPSATFQVVNALLKANKQFEFLVIPGAGHGAMVPGLTRRSSPRAPFAVPRLVDFFVRNLPGPRTSADEPVREGPGPID